MISGLCLGLATRAQLRVDWLRTIAFFLLLLTGGLLGLAYLIALLFVPRIATASEYRDLIDGEPNSSL
ncbi:PspC domain-containing protein [Curtobacterium sp. TXMA1]|uniref:PspC domain-containing protein n=1 Tax=Curtobacterium sp. TXMA1 TaxID=2876939 RepID=UPI00398CD396